MKKKHSNQQIVFSFVLGAWPSREHSQSNFVINRREWTRENGHLFSKRRKQKHYKLLNPYLKYLANLYFIDSRELIRNHNCKIGFILYLIIYYQYHSALFIFLFLILMEWTRKSFKHQCKNKFKVLSLKVKICLVKLAKNDNKGMLLGIFSPENKIDNRIYPMYMINTLYLNSKKKPESVYSV